MDALRPGGALARALVLLVALTSVLLNFTVFGGPVSGVRVNI